MCFYTKEKLITYEEWKLKNKKDHVSKNRLQPTIDHKVSVVYGYNNGILPEIIGNIKNLCVCARWFNTKKNYKIEREYKKEIKKWEQGIEADLDQL